MIYKGLLPPVKATHLLLSVGGELVFVKLAIEDAVCQSKDKEDGLCGR